ncbi:MAG: hypothetical protein JWM80_1400 [Cyanobacteria bacterium RYN_339]|nr:hypothetical protein [Cyanobacteria bacterium RYN_339]
MPNDVSRKIIDLEWPTRYLLECGHAVPIAPDAGVADMAMPGQELVCPECSGKAPPAAAELIKPFKAGEAINAISLNDRLAQIERLLALRGLTAALTRFAADEPINAQTLNQRLEEITRSLA